MASTRTINIRVNTAQAQRQLGRLNSQLNNTGSAATSAGRSASRLSGIIGKAGIAASAALAITSLTRLGESFQRYETLVKSATASTAEFEGISKELIRTSIDTGTSLEANAQVFQRINNALATSGKTSFETAEVVKTLNQAFALSGVNGQEASAALTQLSQAFASGVLRGDEFNSIAEQAPILLRLISDSSGLAESSLRELASEGKLTSDVVFKAIIDGGRQINNEFEDLPVTFDRLGKTLSTLAESGAGQLNETLGELVGKLFGVEEGAVSLTAAVAGGLNEALISIGQELGLIELDRQARVKKLVELEKEVLRTQQQLNKQIEIGSELFIKNAQAAFDRAKANRQAFLDESKANAEKEAQAKEDDRIDTERRAAAEKRKKDANALQSAQEALNQLQAAFVDKATSGDKIIDSINKRYDERISKLNIILDQQIADVDSSDKKLEIEKGISAEIDAQNAARQEAINQRQAEIDAANAEKTARLLGESNESGRALTEGIAGLTAPSGEEQTEFDKLAQEQEALLQLQAEFQANELALLQEQFAQKLLTEEQFQEEKTRLTEDGERDRLEIQQAVENAKQQLTVNSFKSALGALAGFSKKAFKISQAVGIAEATISIARGIAKAQELGFPANIAESARVAAVGVAQIRAIKSAGSGGGSVSTGGSGGGSAPAQTPLSQQQPAASPTRDVGTSRTSEQGQILNELRRVDSEFLPTQLVRNIAARLTEINEESGSPTGGFDE